MKVLPDENQYSAAATKKVESIKIHGLTKAPVQIKDVKSDTVLDKSQYSFADGTLEVTGLKFAIDDGLVYKQEVELLHFVFV